MNRARTAAVAENLSCMSREQRTELGRKLLADASGEVRRSMLGAAADWPMDEAIPLLLAAVESPSTPTRGWPPKRYAGRWPARGTAFAAGDAGPVAEEVVRLKRVSGTGKRTGQMVDHRDTN